VSFLVELDERKRVALARFARHDRYLLTVEPGGTLILTPAVVMSTAEAEYLANPALAAQVEDARSHPERRVARPARRAPRGPTI